MSPRAHREGARQIAGLRAAVAIAVAAATAASPH